METKNTDPLDELLDTPAEYALELAIEKRLVVDIVDRFNTLHREVVVTSIGEAPHRQTLMINFEGSAFDLDELGVLSVKFLADFLDPSSWQVAALNEINLTTRNLEVLR